MSSGVLAPDAVQAMFDRISPIYDPMNRLMTAGLDRRWRRLAVSRVVRPGDRVLDACCGTGDLALAAEEAGGTVTGLDFSQRMLERARHKSSTVEWVRGDAMALPFEDGTFDTVVSTLVLCTVPDPEVALREIHRVLKPGGRLLFMEHIRSESARWARWQDRLNAPWRAFAEGCNCNRATLDMLARSPFGPGAVERGSFRAMVPLIRPLAVGAAVA